MFSFLKRNTARVGIDLADVARFRHAAENKDSHFLHKVFFQSELDYCFSHADPAPHLAGIFSAKEATSKALGVHKVPFAEVCVCHDREGKPEVYRGGKRLAVSISITHTDTVAAAIAVS